MRPSLIVFDLDFTIWNAGGTWCDHTWPPYRRANGYILDSEDNRIFLYPDAAGLVQELSTTFQLAVASRTHRPAWALELLSLFGLHHFFNYLEIYPGSKPGHFHQLHEKSGIPFENMLFFDDEMRNVDDVSRLNVKAVWVDEGISRQLAKKYLELRF
ncbi:MAG: magnesium-dependent phosphatase-1 [Bacteroidales bacterium]|nr:magnesium-dependent phosphatase-1 [Bacteroidales bacterium]